MLDNRLIGVFSHPSFKLAHRDEPLAATPDQAQLRRYVGVEEVRANSDCSRSLSRREGDARDGCRELLCHASPLSSVLELPALAEPVHRPMRLADRVEDRGEWAAIREVIQ